MQFKDELYRLLKKFSLFYPKKTVSTYIYAAEERMFEAASPAIAIVVIGLIPIIILTRMIKNSKDTPYLK